jgi:hypothetical protein
MSKYVYTGSSFNCNLCDYVSAIGPNPHTFCKMHFKKIHPGAIIPLKSEILNFKMNTISAKQSLLPNGNYEYVSDELSLKIMNKY